jgi:DNA-binding response OmpR family regulator
MSASGAGQAIKILKHVRPAMVLLDLRLTDGDGRSVLHFVRRSESMKETPVFIITGATDAADIVGGKGVDRVDGFFEKPLQLPKLLSTVAAVVRPMKQPATSA